MDLIDKEILMELDSDCRVSYQTLADRIGICANSIRRRIENMIDSGVIDRMYVRLCLEMMDADLLLAILQTDGLEDTDTFLEGLRKHPMIEQISAIACGNGGLYLAYAIYRGSEGLAKLSSFLRRQRHIKDLELHTLVVDRGRKVNFNYLHLKVLGCLLDDPRITMVDIRKKIQLSIKKIRKTIEFLQESGAVQFGVHLYPGADGMIEYIVKIELDEKKINSSDTIDWLCNLFPNEFWQPLVSATEPVIFAKFIVESMRDAERILQIIRNQRFIKSASGFVHYSSEELCMPGEVEILQMIETAEKRFL